MRPSLPYQSLKSSSLLAVVFTLAAVTASAQDLTYLDLIHRLTDLEQVAVLPAPGEKMSQWSSYDRKSSYNEATGKYVAWDANGDGDGIIRKEGGKLVFAEMEGPGCIWRMWSAMPKEGKVQVYLDGAAQPVVDLPFIGYFDRKNEPFTRSALVHTVARGWNNYTPIPYQKSCKIVADPGWGAYYQFVYQTFPKGTRVPTFKRELTPAESAAMDQANARLTQCDRPDYREEKRLTSTVKLLPGKSSTVATIEGQRAITGIRVRLPLPPPSADRDLLRELALQIQWDREREPSVWAPLGDFFGTAGGNNYRSFPLGHTGDEWWYSHWFMPFAKEAKVTLVNDGKAARDITIEITYAPLSKPIGEYGRFHAKWHRDVFLPKEPERAIDWPMVVTQGRGRFAGVMLHVWNPRGGWWGEGDEKFHVDGEKFPSTFGTGSEDYFGYAWCDPGLFENAFHNQTLNDGNNKGHVSVNRWHITDNIPFQQRFDGYIEKYYPNSRPTLYAATAYWYLSPDGSDPYKPVPLAERVGYWGPAQVLTLKVPGAIEGERLKVTSCTAGNPHEQDLSGFDGQWSNDAHLWWISARPGDRLELALPVNQEGKYKLIAQFTKAPDYGILQLSLDGQKLGQPRDFYHPSVVPTGQVDLGTHQLTAGDHKLMAEITGANEKAVKNYMFGLDYVKLERIQ